MSKKGPGGEESDELAEGKSMIERIKNRYLYQFTPIERGDIDLSQSFDATTEKVSSNVESKSIDEIARMTDLNINGTIFKVGESM